MDRFLAHPYFESKLLFSGIPCRKQIFFCMLFIITIFGTTVCAQKLKFEHFGTREGLPATEVYNLFQDKKGYIWAFAEYGIVKHNGTSFIPVCQNIPFNESAVYVVRESPTKEMYIANSQAHIYRIKNDSAFPIRGMEKISQRLPSNKKIMFDMLIDDSSNIYFSTLQNSYLVRKGQVTHLSSLYKEKATCFKKVGENYILLIKGTGTNSMVQITDFKDSVIYQTLIKPFENKRNIIREKKGNYYLLVNDELIRWDRSGKLTKRRFEEATITMEVSPEGNLWIGTMKGLIGLDSSLNITGRYFTNTVVSDILFDNHHGMWVSTIDQGIYYCKNIYARYSDVQELSGNITLLKQLNGKLMIGTADGHLFTKDNSRLIKQNIDNARGGSLTDIIFHNNQYITSFKNNITVHDHQMNLLAKVAALSDQGQAVSIYEFAEPGEQLLSISGSAVVKKSKNNNRFILVGETGTKNRCIIKRGSGYLIGTSDGIFYLDSTYQLRHSGLLKGKVVLKLIPDRNKNIWVCTKGNGLHMLTPPDSLTPVPDIPSTVVNHIGFLNDTTILLSTNKGLFVNNLNTIFENQLWNRIVDNEVMSTAIYNDEVHIATKEGLIILHKQHLFNEEAFEFYLESIQPNNKKIPGDPVEFSHNDKDLYFIFDILAYKDPGHSLRYELDGPSPAKGDISGPELHFQNLSPGRYHLTVAVLSNAYGNQQKNLAISFYIKPAFWQTKLFLTAIILTSLFCVILIIWFSSRRIRRNEARKTLVARKLATHRLTALKAQINPHFVSNTLTAVQQLIFAGEIDRANQYIARFSHLIRYVLKHSDKAVTYLDDEIKLIDIIVELEQLRFNNSFLFEKDISANINPEEIFVPPLIIQPIIENAIWHGLLPLNGTRTPKLTLKIAIRNDTLAISVIDNGVGRQDLVSTKSEDPVGRESKGTWLIKTWMENLNQLFPARTAAINFIDLMDEQNRPAGTQVDITLPLETSNSLYQ